MASQPPVLSDADIMRVRGQASPPLAPSGPRVIEGTRPPREPPAQTTTQAEIDRIRAERDRLQLDADRRNAADPSRSAPNTQLKDAGFYLRAARADQLYQMHQVDPRGVVGQTAADAFPRIANANANSERQMSEAAQREFIMATLRYESGAAISAGEIENQRMQYFPQPGDSPETIAFKAQLRRNAIEGLQRSAGPAATGIDTSIPEALQTPSYQAGGNILEAGAAVLRHEAAAPGAAQNGGPPNAPPDPNRVQPGESMGQVGTLPNVPVDSGRNVAGAAGARITPHDRQVTAAANALVNSRLPVPEVIRRINQILEAEGRQLLTAGQYDAIQSARRNGARFEFVPTPGGQSQRERAIDAFRNITGAGGAVEAGVGNALDSASLGLPGLFSESYRNALGDLRENHPIASTVGAIVGGIAAPGGPRPGMNLLTQTGRSAAQGAAYGLNESGGDPENALVGGLMGAAAPGAFNLAGRAVRPVVNALSRAPVTPAMQEVARAAEQEGVRVSPPVVDPRLRDRMMYLEASPGTGNIVREGAQATRLRNEAVGLETTRGDISNRVADLTAGGTAQEPGTMGNIIQNAGARELKTVRGRLGRDYDRAEQMVQDVPLYGREFVNNIDSQLAELNRNPSRNGAVINYLNSVRRDFVDENGQLIPKSMRDFRDLRTDLRGNLNHQNLTQTSAERRMTMALQAARRDVRRDLVDIHTLDPSSEMGQRARAGWELYRRTDVGWEQQARLQRQVLDRIIGPADNPKEGSAVMEQVRRLAASGNAVEDSRLARMWQTMSKQEQRDTAATIAQHFGRKSEDDAFSPQNFITETARIQPSARRLIFGEEGAQSIANLRVLSRNLDGALKRLNNSRSGTARNWGQFLRELRYGGSAGTLAGALGGGSMLTSGATGLAIGAASAAIGTAVRKLSARSLMTPQMSRWLAAASTVSTPSAIRQHIARLAVVERANPALTQEISGLRQALLNAVNDNAGGMTRAAASPGNNEQQSQ